MQTPKRTDNITHFVFYLKSSKKWIFNGNELKIHLVLVKVNSSPLVEGYTEFFRKGVERN